MRKGLKYFIPLGLLAVAFPCVLPGYYMHILILVLLWITMASAWNLLGGFAGQVSFGHALFFGVGAYATALALTHVSGMPVLGALLAGALAAFLCALVLSPLMSKVSGTAFAMLTLAFGQLLYVLCLKFREVTGGEDGVTGYPIPPFSIPGIASFELRVPQNFYYFAMIVLGLCALGMWFAVKTPFGSIVVAVRDNARRVNYLGFRVQHTKAVMVILSGVFAGISGSVFALFQKVVSTDSALSATVSFAPLMMAYVGGIGNFFGPILGSGILHLLDEFTSRYIQRVDLVNGAVFIFVVLFAPNGFIGLYRAIRERLIRKATLGPVGEAEEEIS
jgi:branched-chain amino acid transport system permease protein